MSEESPVIPNPQEDLQDLDLTPEQAEMVEIVQTTRQENIELLKEIHSMGREPSSLNLLHLRIDALLEILDPNSRLVYEVVYERNVNTLFTQAASEARKEKLTNGSGNTLIVPGGATS